MQNDQRSDTGVKPFHMYFPRVFEYLREIPCVRREKVNRMRRKLACGVWDPGSKKVAEKILSEHLFDLEFFNSSSFHEPTR